MPVVKRFIKTISVNKKYFYRLQEVTAGASSWLEAEPISRGVTRTAEDERVLTILLENDALQMDREEVQRTRAR